MNELRGVWSSVHLYVPCTGGGERGGDGDKLGPPTLTGGDRKLRVDEVAELQCTPGPQLQGEPRPRLWWLLDGQEVGPSLVEQHGGGSYSSEPDGISVSVDGSQVVAAGGSMHVECRVSVGSLHNSAVAMLRVAATEQLGAVRAAATSLSSGGGLGHAAAAAGGAATGFADAEQSVVSRCSQPRKFYA
ncbi:hypothetical protein FHG87_007662 [Trinorchestia longiramus]|nr:hypothetical protein FHG87_007662 [Trinorchestia longiramus]